jgi:hypothetical protein
MEEAAGSSPVARSVEEGGLMSAARPEKVREKSRHFSFTFGWVEGFPPDEREVRLPPNRTLPEFDEPPTTVLSRAGSGLKDFELLRARVEWVEQRNARFGRRDLTEVIFFDYAFIFVPSEEPSLWIIRGKSLTARRLLGQLSRFRPSEIRVLRCVYSLERIREQAGPYLRGLWMRVTGDHHLSSAAVFGREVDQSPMTQTFLEREDVEVSTVYLDPRAFEEDAEEWKDEVLRFGRQVIISRRGTIGLRISEHLPDERALSLALSLHRHFEQIGAAQKEKEKEDSEAGG